MWVRASRGVTKIGELEPSIEGMEVVSVKKCTTFAPIQPESRLGLWRDQLLHLHRLHHRQTLTDCTQASQKPPGRARETNCFPATSEQLQSTGNTYQNSWQPQLVLHIHHKWHTGTFYETDLVTEQSRSKLLPCLPNIQLCCCSLWRRPSRMYCKSHFTRSNELVRKTIRGRTARTSNPSRFSRI